MNFKGINAVCIQNIYPLPLMKDMLGHLAKGEVFTKLNLQEEYYRIRIKEGDDEKPLLTAP